MSHPDPMTWPGYARHVIECTTRRRETGNITPPPDATRPHSGVFVTLHKLGRLRGCMGILDPSLPLPEAVRHAATMASGQDPRFPPLAPDELSLVDIEVSILSPPFPMNSLDDLELGRHGIIIQRGTSRGLFLPQVATTHKMDKETFITRCCTEKAGLPADTWRDPDTTVQLFTAEVIHEEKQ